MGTQADHMGERQLEKAVSFGGRRLHQAQSGAAAAKKDGKTVAQKMADFIVRHRRDLLIFGGLGLMLLFVMGIMQSCTSMFGSSFSAMAGASSDLPEDADLTGAEATYCEMEAELQVPHRDPNRDTTGN